MTQIIITLAYLLAFISKPSQCVSSNPIFLTTLPNIEAGTWVLTASSPTTSSGFSFQNTVVNYINAYTSIPSVGLGIDFISSVYQTSLTAQYLIDLSTVQRLQTYAMIQLNRTANSITQLSVNYVVCDSSFWLDIRQTLVDLSGTVAFTSASSLARSVVVEIAYKTKSNSTNAQLAYNTIGVDMYRQNTHLFVFEITLAAKSLSSFNLSILVGGNNRIRTIRICSFSYEAIANSVDPPFYIDLGIVNSFSGTFPDSSALTISAYGTIYTGIVDWMIDDANSVLDYNMVVTGLSFSLTTTSISQSKTAYFWYRRQSCPDYTFLNNHVCDSCHFSCLTCFSTAETGCLSCPTTRTYVSTNRTCPCITSYVNVNVTLCVQLTCQPTCLTCANLDQCGTCDSNLGRYLSGINCVCNDYFIDVYATMGQRICFPCHMTCQTCSVAFSETACTSCNLSKDKRSIRASNNTCACTDRFYQPTGTMSPVCASCHYSCSKCLTGAVCTECNSTRGRVINSTSQLCSCTSQFYDNLLNEQCVTCPYRCLTCNSQGCRTCNSSLFRQISSRECICMKGYFDDNVNGLCQRCDFTCSTCNSLAQCGSCNSSLQRYMDISTGKQLCLCAARFYSVTGIEQCMFCSSNCVTCNGPNDNNCLTCDTTKFREISIDKRCVCKAGYFQLMPTIQTCSICNHTCETCDNGVTCLTCSAVNFRLRDASNRCQCMNGYYDNGNQLCLRCDYRCLTCSSSATCLTCDSSTRNTTSLSNCICLTGFWDDGISSSCKPCLAECSACTDGNGCTDCPTNKMLTITRYCACMPKTYPPNCINCNYNCQQCTNTAIQCTKCNGTAMRYLNTTTKSCICYDGYFNDGVKQQCATCHQSCLTCTSFASCLLCPPNRIKVGALCSCDDKFFENTLNKNCLPCHYSCKTCQAFAQCTSCDATKFRNFPITGPSNLTACTCVNGYYDNFITELCYKCDAKCLTCSAFSTCLSCDSALNRYFVSADKNCLCLDGYYEDTTTFLCVRCDLSCRTCGSSTSCLTCLTGRSIPSGGGFCLCQNGTFDHPTARTCTTCSYPCLRCSSTSTTCTSCDGTRNLLTSPVFQCQCKIGTFQNGTACDSCLSTCSECTNKISCTLCRPGTNRNLDGSNLCPCISGFHDEGSTLLTCLRCHQSCLTCSSALSCINCFPGRLPVASSTCACPAQRFYDDGVNGACVPCAYNCLTCLGLPTTCRSCSSLSYRDLTNDNCICKIGYFEDNVQVCVKCHYSCRSCSSLSSCITCDSALHRVYLGGPLCSCQPGYFDNGVNGECQPCDYTCKECTGVATRCTSCPDTRKIDQVNNKCPCEIGLFDATLPTCVACLYSCKQCVNAEECTSCLVTTRNLQESTKQCLCNDGLYDVNLQQNCPSCDPLCLTCTDYSNCLTCDTTNNLRYLLNAACVCSNGFYDNWTLSANMDPICRRCHYSCENCVSLTQCTSCSLLGQRIYNVSSKLCSCKAGFYDKPQNMPCIKCPSDCLTCSDQNTCINCPDQRTLNPTSFRCDCATSFYANGTTCELCPVECTTCTNLSHCTLCNGQRILIGNKCICAVGSFMVPNTALCTGCQHSCQTCVSSLMCSTCNAANKRFLSGSFCRCMTGFYDDNVTQPCLSCHQSCRSCIQGGKCLSCNLAANRVLNLVSRLCECLTGFYEDPTTKLCIRCHLTCVTCLTGNTCQTCNNLHYRMINTTNSQCQCPVIGYFDDNTQSMCQTCDFKCLSCRTSATTCTACITSSNRLLQVDKCNCLTGYFDNGALTCSKCSPKCLTCQGVADNCTSCSSVALRTTSPTCACQVGFFDDGVNSLCKPCDYRCQSCSNPFTCDSCDATKHRTLNPTTKICDCMPVYYDQLNTSNCIPCTFSCVTCAHPTLCLTCPSTRTYKNGICECNIKRYEDFSSLECPTCDYSCKACTNATECSSCSVLMSRVFNSSTRKCSCVQGFYDTGLQQELCLRCEKSCFTCTNFTNCLTCPSNVNKTINATISPLCTCLYGYYEDINAGIAIGQSSVCYACHYSCQKCSGQSYACTECQAAKHRYLNTQKQCICEQFYFDDGRNELCIKCTTNCLACWGEGSSQCLTCDNSTYILNNQCYTNCPNYYRNFITTSSIKTCKLCTPFCLKCTSSETICQQCQTTHRLFKFNQSHILCIDYCPQFYYQEPVTKECLECKPPCYHCSNKYVCTDCLSGYYLDTYCYKCHPFCFSCSGPTVFDCITCVNGYYLDNGLCRKLTCGQFQYVHSLNGCVNCTTTYPNSLTCDSQVIKTCKDNYKLQTTKLSNGLISSICKTCGQVPGYKMNIMSNGEIQCAQICGDGIIINDQCDDGNTLNGDGCSEFCKIERNWVCVNKTRCDLKANPQMKVVRTVKVERMNRIQVYLELTIGLRLVKENFVLSFTGGAVKFDNQIQQLDSKFTKYKLVINYQTTIQSVKLAIKVVSPVSQVTSLKNSLDQQLESQHNEDNPLRTLQQSQLDIPLQIELNLQLQIQITTQPPATYINTQTRTVFSYLVYLFMTYQIVCVLLTFWLLYKRIKFMLIVVDLITSMRVLYLLSTFAMHNITQLVPTIGKGLQPFVYPFGPTVQNVYSPFYDAGYTKLIFSSCCIQVGVLFICLAIKYLSDDRKTQNQGHYYLNAFIYCCSIDIYLSCISIIAETQFSSYIGSYSWAFAILILMALIMHNVMYIAQGKSAIYKNRTILPTKSFATGDLDMTKEKQLNNQVLDTSEFHSNNNYQEDSADGQVWSEHHTQVLKSQKAESIKQKEKESKPKQFTQTKESLLSLISINTGHQYDLYDLAPSVQYSISKANTFYGSSSVFYESSSRNKLSLYHLPILNNLLPLVLVLVTTLIKTGNNYLLVRSSLLLGLFFVAFVFLLLEKPETIKSSARNIKLIFNYCIYLSICVILVIATVTKSQNHNQWIDLSILTIIVLFFIGSITFWFVNLKYSPQYKEYLIDLRNQQIIERNKQSQQPRKKIYTGVDDNSFNNSPIKNIFRKQPEKYIPQSLQSHSVSQANSVNSENSYNNRNSRHAENVFEQNQVQSPTQQHHYNQRIHFVQSTHDKQLAKQTKIKAINEYDAYLSSYGTFAAVKQPKKSQTIIIKNPNPSQIKQKPQKTNEQVRISSNLSEPNSNIITKKTQGNDAIKKSIKLDNQQFIQKHKRVSPRKISTLAKVQRKDDNINHNSLILDNDLTVLVEEPNRKITKRIDGNTDEKLLELIKNQQQKSDVSQKHYMYRNPPAQPAPSKSKPKSKGKSNGSLHSNKSLPKKLKTINNATANLDQKILMFEQSNNPRNNLTQVSDLVDNETNQPNESRSKGESKITDYSLQLNKAQLKKQNYESDQSLEVQKQRTGEVKSSFSQQYHELNRQVLKQSNNDGISSGLQDDLSDGEYELQFPTGINSRANKQRKRSGVQDEGMMQGNRPRKFKKSQSQQRGIESKKQSREKRPSISPSKLSVYHRPHLEDISSIDEGQQVFSQVSQLGIEELNVYNKILKDHQKYKDKRVDKKFIEKELRRKDNNDSLDQDD